MRKYKCDGCGTETAMVVELTARQFVKHSKDTSVDALRMMWRRRYCAKCYLEILRRWKGGTDESGEVTT